MGPIRDEMDGFERLLNSSTYWVLYIEQIAVGALVVNNYFHPLFKQEKTKIRKGSVTELRSQLTRDETRFGANLWSDAHFWTQAWHSCTQVEKFPVSVLVG